MTAIRNKNGKDWWIIVPKWKTNCYFIIPVTSSGVGIPIKQCVGLNWQEIDRGGQIDISPDGTKYSRVNKRDTVMIFDFNSETGQLTNLITLNQPNKESFLQGVCFSQNSRFLYVMHLQKVYQFDLQATDIQGSIQVVGDVSSIQQDGEKGLLQFSKLAPDGKIYISSPFNHRYLSVINRPNCSGKLCDFRPYAIELKFYNASALPNNPHFTIPPANYNCDSINTATEENIENIAIYPNPATTQITILSSHAFQQFDIIALTGQTMLKGKLSENMTDIDVSILPEGIYFIKLTNPLTQTRALGKFVLKR